MISFRIPSIKYKIITREEEKEVVAHTLGKQVELKTSNYLS
jgi:hypothetical protein